MVGITGPPGAGKSTLVNRLIAKYRALGKKVAILAIDPSSPFSGGAVLGDRVRMTDHYKDAGVYIRSLSSRGSHGGLSRAAREIVKLLDAFGHDVIIIETVGVGQTELSIMDLADTTVVVTVPEGGDGVQVMKAGLNEIADVFVVNKADREGADRVKAELELNVHLRAGGRMASAGAADAGRGRQGRRRGGRRDREASRVPARASSTRRASPSGARASSSKCCRPNSRSARSRARRTTARAPKIVAEVRAGKLNPYSAARRMLEDRNRRSICSQNGGSKPAKRLSYPDMTSQANRKPPAACSRSAISTDAPTNSTRSSKRSRRSPATRWSSSATTSIAARRRAT